MRLWALAEALDIQLTDRRLELYLEALSDLPFGVLRCSLEAMLKTSKFFPRIPEIREAVLGPLASAVDAELEGAENAWQHVLAYVDRWHPDIGPFRDAPALCGREIQAMRHVGGVYRIWLEQDGGPGLPFLRKDFIAAWRNLRASPSGEEAIILADKTILKTLETGKRGRTMWQIRNLADFERQLHAAVRRRDLDKQVPTQALGKVRFLGMEGNFAVVSIPEGVRHHVTELMLLRALDDCGERVRGVKFV
ncbi:MAG: hypothetical protein ABSG54_08365 [Terriglobia bacterium]|jgi:hypothetical protein